ncbi:MAG TPA: RNA-binding S4 domain-containing protein [Brumimicrobium sp.]|nr:RNA-binding S4 domain-containing protein [Brumimicrobium sp.]
MKVRIDKYIWFTRLAKTRTKATELINKGKVKLNGQSIKPSSDVKIGDEIGMVKHTSLFTYKVKDMLDRRVGAKLVEDYLVETTSPEELEKYKLYQATQSAYRKHGTGKPTKKDRRDLEDFFDWDDDDFD